MMYIINPFRRLLFIPIILICMLLGILTNLFVFAIYNPFYWVFTGEAIPDYWNDEIWEFFIKNACKILPNEERIKII